MCMTAVSLLIRNWLKCRYRAVCLWEWGYGLSEQLILDEKTGRPLNGTLLDYKLMTMMDTPDIKADFVELDDPIGPFGNKALGEPPAIPGAPAIRNAVLHATGVAFNENPLTPQRLIYGFIKGRTYLEGRGFYVRY